MIYGRVIELVEMAIDNPRRYCSSCLLHNSMDTYPSAPAMSVYSAGWLPSNPAIPVISTSQLPDLNGGLGAPRPVSAKSAQQFAAS